MIADALRGKPCAELAGFDSEGKHSSCRVPLECLVANSETLVSCLEY